jgi:hypothetical protein
VSLDILNGSSPIPAESGGSFATTARRERVGRTSVRVWDEGPVTPSWLSCRPPRPSWLVIPTVGQIKGKTARLPIRCVGPANCVGDLRIQNLPEPGATVAKKAKKRKPITYASGSFSISAGKTLSVTVKLSKDGKRAIKRHRPLKAYANATFSDGHGKSSKITFRR